MLTCEHVWINAFELVLRKLNARVLQEADRLFRVHVLRQVEFEVELPSRDTGVRQIALVVQKGQTKLDYFQQVNIALKLKKNKRMVNPLLFCLLSVGGG